MSYRNHGEETAAALAAHHAGEVRQLRPDGAAVPSGHDDPLGALYRSTTAKPGCPGVRVDGEGREWYSSCWIDLAPAADRKPAPPPASVSRLLL